MNNYAMILVQEWWDWMKKTAYVLTIFVLAKIACWNVLGKDIEPRLPSYNVVQSAQADAPDHFSIDLEGLDDKGRARVIDEAERQAKRIGEGK